MRAVPFVAMLVAAANLSAAMEETVLADLPTDRLATESIQRAIDAKSASGGGTVTVPAGVYTTGSVWLKDGVTLRLARGCVLQGSTNYLDYATFRSFVPNESEFLIRKNAQSSLDQMRAIVSAICVTNVALTGEGRIDGRGWAAYRAGRHSGSPDRWRDAAFFRCRDVLVEGVTLENAASWTLFFRECENVVARGLRIDGHANFNNDGIDIDAKNVLVEDCRIDSDDDAVCLKSHNPAYVVENVEVRNCRVSSNCNFLKLGTAGYGGFKNVRIHDCTLVPCRTSKFRFWDRAPNLVWAGIAEPVSGRAAIALEVPDGGRLEDVRISGIDFTAGGVQTPVLIRLGRRHANPDGCTARLEGVVIENVKGRAISYIASSITGVPGLRPKDITIRNCAFELKAGCPADLAARKVPEMERRYPENGMFDTPLPAYGFYLRHCDGVRFENVTLTPIGGEEMRPPYVQDDCTGVRRTEEFVGAHPTKCL